MKHLIIGPGGILFYSLFGQVCKLHDDKMFQNLEEISGSSAGALTGFLYLCGQNMLDKVKEYIFSVEYGETFSMNPMRLLKRYGLIYTRSARDFLSTMCSKVFGFSDITFYQLYERTGIIFHISSLSLFKRHVEYFSVRTTPHMSVLDAVCMSVAAPFVFTPFKDHIDAGIVEFLPFGPFIGKDDVVSIMNSQDIYEPPKKNIFRYIFTIMNILSTLRHDESFSHRITIPSPSVGMFDFKQTQQDRMRLFVHGYSVPSGLPCVDVSDQGSECDTQTRESPKRQSNQDNPGDLSASETQEVAQSSEDISQVLHPHQTRGESSKSLGTGSSRDTESTPCETLA